MKRFIYARFGQLELARSVTGLHLAVTQDDGRTATYWLTRAEALDLYRRLGGLLEEEWT